MAFSLLQHIPAPPRPTSILEQGTAIKSTQGKPMNKDFAQVWSGWFRRLQINLNKNNSIIQAQFSAGYNGSVVLAKITVGGTNGSLTVANGLITAYVAPT